MAFIFVPNSDGSFTEGDRQVNPDTGVEYTYTSGAWRALGPKIEDEFDALDERYVNKTGDTMSGQLTIENSRNFAMKKADGSTQFEMRPNTADYFTNIYSYNAGGMRFRVATEQNAGIYDTMISLTGETQEIGDTTYRGTAYINRVRTPTNNDHAVNKWYVDDKVAASGGGVPVGSIMIWMNSDAPDGWFKLQGSNFDVSKYPLLHAYLQGTSGYTSGKLPNWGGYYPGEYGDHLTHLLGSKQGYKTGQPSAGAPRSSASIPNGNTRTFNATGGTNAYSDGKGKVTIDENWDATTRPKTVVVHYIIKHD